ncbi:MAG: AzlD domain-containing protein [Bdellovibrionota bacterium]
MIDSNYFWINIAFLSIGTFSIRFSIIALSARVKINERVKQLFSYIPSAVLPAFIAPAVFFHQGHVAWAFEKERLIVLILASAVCYFFRSTLATIAFGLVALYVIS